MRFRAAIAVPFRHFKGWRPCQCDRRLKALFVLSLLCLFAAVSSTFAGTVTGVVHNGTNGKPAAGIDVILIQLQGGMQPVANTKTDADGKFQFDNPTLGTAPMLVRAVYRGVNYHEPVPPGKTSIEVQVFDPTDKSSAFAVATHAVILQPNGAELLVGEEYDIQNKTQPPMAFYKADGSFLFNVPAGADFGQAAAWGSSGMPVVQGTIDKGKGQQAIAFAFRPGESGVRLSYKMPYSGNRATVRNVTPYAVQRLMIVAPPSLQVSGEGLTPAGQEQGFAIYTRDNVPANTPISVTISGSAALPTQGAAEGNPHGGTGGAPMQSAQSSQAESAQNPSVNSRIEQSGAEAPVATATAMPARLNDNLKYILLGGFALVFALGAVFLWRRPQVAVAGDGAAAIAAPGAASRGPRTPKSARAVSAVNAVVAGAPLPSPDAASAAASAALAEADSEVRGSLDQLKDNLFRLELRHQAGTITEEDYARERQRDEKVLRDLVRG
jgi:hypothetical protein